MRLQVFRRSQVTVVHALEKFVRLTAPGGKADFLFKLTVLIVICGILNHLRHLLVYGLPGQKTYWENLFDASFTALPMGAFGLMLIGHLNALQRRLYLQATRDPLTDLPNRRWFMEKAPETLAPAQAVMIIDIDHFKRINDTFGHDIGDACLVQMARHLENCIETGDILARIGGEEFAAVIVQADEAKLDRIATKMTEGIVLHAGERAAKPISVSVGIARSTDMLPRLEAMNLADKAVYLAKSGGRAQYRTCAKEKASDMRQPRAVTIPAA